MKHYTLKLAYDGTNYYGWQKQTNKPSINQTILDSFCKTFGSKSSIIGASRTDAGVHALGQIVLCKTDLNLPSKNVLKAWNNTLPNDILIRSLTESDSDFHPHYNVAQKTYFYHFFTNRPLPFFKNYGWHYPYTIDYAILEKALSFFIGTHDFCSFRNSEDTRENTIRTIDTISLEYIKRYNVYRITVKGQKFLRHMIRRIVGASIAIASKKNRPLSLLHDIMIAKNPNHILPNAPAHGLLLYNITYSNKGKK